MPNIKINYQPEIFDDPEYCDSYNSGTKCYFIERHYASPCYCSLFRKVLKGDNHYNYKCGECKNQWQQANESRPPKTLPEGHRLG